MSQTIPEPSISKEETSDEESSDSSDEELFSGASFKPGMIQQLYQKKNTHNEKVIKLPANNKGQFLIDIRITPMRDIKKIPKSEHWKQVKEKLVFITQKKRDVNYAKLKKIMKTMAREMKNDPQAEVTINTIKKFNK